MGYDVCIWQVLNPVGREIALQRGANVVMPIITPSRFRKNYEVCVWYRTNLLVYVMSPKTLEVVA